MKRFSFVLAVCILFAAAVKAPSAARAQTSPDAVLPTPPAALRSVLGASAVPVVHPPRTPHRRRLHGHAAAVASAKPATLPPTPAPQVPKTGVAAAAAVAAAATTATVGAAVAAPPANVPPRLDPTKGTVTGLPLPRWVAFRSDEVNLRSGPGTQYPIDWQYHRRNLPVRITREFDAWRLVADPDGTKGWVHQATLTGRRGFMVKDAERTLRQSADDAAKPVALLKPGVVGYIRSCPAQAAWCEVQAGDYRGWMKRADFYGVDPDEAIN